MSPKSMGESRSASAELGWTWGSSLPSVEDQILAPGRFPVARCVDFPITHGLPCLCRSSFRPSSGLLLAVWGRCLVAMSCPTLCDPTDCSLPGSSVLGISQASIQEWVAISFSRGSSQPRDWELLHGQASSLWLSHQGSPSQGSPTPRLSYIFVTVFTLMPSAFEL